MIIIGEDIGQFLKTTNTRPQNVGFESQEHILKHSVPHRAVGKSENLGGLAIIESPLTLLGLGLIKINKQP